MVLAALERIGEGGGEERKLQLPLLGASHSYRRTRKRVREGERDRPGICSTCVNSEGVAADGSIQHA